MICDAGKVIHSMTAHLDSVTSLAVDPHGLYLLSGGILHVQDNHTHNLLEAVL